MNKYEHRYRIELLDPLQILIQGRRSFPLGQDWLGLGMPTCLEYAQTGVRGNKRES